MIRRMKEPVVVTIEFNSILYLFNYLFYKLELYATVIAHFYCKMAIIC